MLTYTSQPIMPTTVLITLGSSKQAHHLIPIMLAQPDENYHIKAFCHSLTTGTKLLHKYGQPHNLSIVVGDQNNPREVAKVFENEHVDVVYHIAPPFSVDEEHNGINFIRAAQKAGVRHFVYSSVLHPIRKKMIHHHAKLNVEEYLAESTLNYTVLQPTHFFQNINVKAAVDEGSLKVPYNPENEMGFVDLRDVSEVAFKVIEEGAKHYRARYELVGDNQPYSAIASTIASVSGKDVTAERAEAAQVAKVMSKGDKDAYERAIRMLVYYDSWGLTGSTNILEWMLGRKPTGAEEYVRYALGQ
jgi:uncharacterized protein YbjT (DUF2867 family)